jgi:hypothetical protein
MYDAIVLRVMLLRGALSQKRFQVCLRDESASSGLRPRKLSLR